MYTCCEDHVELALDIIVDEKETAPIMEKLNKGEKLSTRCNFCEKEASYKISG